MDHPFKRLWAYLTGGRLVCLQDFDGEETVMIAYYVPKVKYFDPVEPKLVALRMTFSDTKVILNDDGTTTGLSFVSKWMFI